jgi:hypothetical protein
MTNEKTRWIPKGYEPLRAEPDLGLEVLGAEVTTPSGATKWYAIAYAGKRTKSDWHYSFKTRAQVDAQIEKTIESLKASHDLKARLKAERTAPHDVKIRDVFRSSWGYDQTNVDFYQVISVTKSMVEVRAIGQESEETGFMSGQCVPRVDDFRGEPIKKRVNMQGGEPSISIYSFANAYRIKPVTTIGDKPVFDSSYFSYYA